MDAESLFKACDKLEEGMRILARGPREYYLRRLVACYAMLLDKFAPFKRGDKVQIVIDLEIKPDSGWYYFREKLRPGCIGEVLTVECDGFEFGALVAFGKDNFFMRQNYIERVADSESAQHD
jgi:hypothetical protein